MSEFRLNGVWKEPFGYLRVFLAVMTDGRWLPFEWAFGTYQHCRYVDNRFADMRPST